MSQLPHLLPLASVVLALGLAYLKLDRFHYRQRIQGHARAALKLLRNGGLQPRHEEAEYVRQLRLFAGLVQRERISEFPKIWGTVYSLVYCSTVDRIVSGLSVIGSMSIIMIGSCHAVSRLQSLNPLFDEEQIGLTLYALIALFGFSIFLVLYGAHIEHKSRQIIDNNAKQTQIFLTEESASAFME